MDRRHGKRPLPSDVSSEDGKEGLISYTHQLQSSDQGLSVLDHSMASSNRLQEHVQGDPDQSAASRIEHYTSSQPTNDQGNFIINDNL